MTPIRKSISVKKMTKTIIFWTPKGYQKRIVPMSETELKRRLKID